MPEPAATSNQQFMFSTEEWGMVSNSQIERATVPEGMDEEQGVLIVWTKGMAGGQNSRWTARYAISGDALSAALVAAGLILEA